MSEEEPLVEPKPFDVVQVEWDDSYIDSTAQHESPERALAAYRRATRRTIGWWAGQTEDVVCVCTDDDRLPGDEQAIAGPMYIPQGMVVSLSIIAEADDRTAPV